MRIVREINYQDARMRMLRDEREDFFVDVNIERLSLILGYESKNGVEVIMNRNPYLKTREFSRMEKIVNIEDGTEKIRDIRVFTEDGIMEVAFLASTEKAREFRAFMRHLIKQLRTNQNPLAVVQNNENLIAMQDNYNKMAESYEGLKGITSEVLETLNNQNNDGVMKALDTIEKELLRAGKKLDKIDGIEKRLDKLEGRFGGLENRLGKLEDRMDNIDEKFGTLGKLFK